MNTLKKIWHFLKEIFVKFGDDNCFILAASLSYFTIISLAPILIIVISLASLVIGQETIKTEIFSYIRDMIGPESAQTVRSIIERAYQPEQSIKATLLGIGALFFAATTLFFNLKKSLNLIWGVKVEPKTHQLIKLLKDRLLSFAMILGIGFLLLVSLILNAVLSAIINYFSSLVPLTWVVGFGLMEVFVTLVVITMLFAMLFKVLPDAYVRWKDVWIGALVTSILFNLGRVGIGIYIGNSDFTQTFGSAAALIVILIWVYYSSLIMFFGAEFTQVYSCTHGERHIGKKGSCPDYLD